MGLVNELAERAIRRQGLSTKAALARRLGVQQSRLHEWIAGSRSCPAARIQQLAKLAEVDPMRSLARYLLEREERKG